MPRHSPDLSASPPRRRSSPRRRSPSRRDRSPPPPRPRSSRKSISPPPSRDRHYKRSEARTEAAAEKPPQERSPSPRSKRLRRAQAEKEVERAAEKEHERNGSGRERERAAKHREKGSERERGERRSGRDGNGGEGSKPRRERSVSPAADRYRRDRDRDRDRHRHASRSRSPPRAARNGAHDEERNSRGTEQHKTDDSVSKTKAAEEALESKTKQKPSFELSGKLAAETNRVRGITLLFNEPPDARKPDIRWRLYVFKGGDVLNEPLYIHRQSCYLFGRERRVADIPTDHPSCSKQHAVIQFRQVEKEQPDGMLSKQIRPYLMDLGSTNKTFLNDNPIEPQRYYELFEKDTIKFGNSSREYVLLHENSAS